MDARRSPFFTRMAGPAAQGVAAPAAGVLSGGGNAVLALFRSGEQGVWFEPSEFLTLFQDAAGATPVTALEQPVGRSLDKSGNGAHATQATAGARPVLSARYNLLQRTEQATNAAWAKGANATVTDNVAAGPRGAQAFRIGATALVSGFVSAAQVNTKPAAALAYRARFLVQATPSLFLHVFLDAGTTANAGRVIVNATTWAVHSTTNFGSFSGVSASVAPVPGFPGWHEVILTTTTGTETSVRLNILWSRFSNTVTFTPQAGDEVLIAAPDVRLASDLLVPPYQRVVTATEYSSGGFPIFLRNDGVDDSLPATSPNLGTAATLFFATEAGVTVQGAQTIGAGAFETLRGARTFAVGAVNRALTTAEAANLTRYLNRAAGILP